MNSRYFWTILSLVGLLLWLVGSYTLPPTGLSGSRWLGLSWSHDWLQVAALVVLLLFVAGQLWLLGATFAIRAAFVPPSLPQAGSRLQLKLSTELFWTFLPLVMTLGLAWISYQTWLSVPTV